MLGRLKNQRKAFTLAEVLITIGIIGIVAAVTIPALIHNYQARVLETKYKKSVAVIANGIRMMMAQEDALGDVRATKLNECYVMSTTGEGDSGKCFTEVINKYFVPLSTFEQSEFTDRFQNIRYTAYVPDYYGILAMPAYADEIDEEIKKAQEEYDIAQATYDKIEKAVGESEERLKKLESEPAYAEVNNSRKALDDAKEAYEQATDDFDAAKWAMESEKKERQENAKSVDEYLSNKIKEAEAAMDKAKTDEEKKQAEEMRQYYNDARDIWSKYGKVLTLDEALAYADAVVNKNKEELNQLNEEFAFIQKAGVSMETADNLNKASTAMNKAQKEYDAAANNYKEVYSKYKNEYQGIEKDIKNELEYLDKVKEELLSAKDRVEKARKRLEKLKGGSGSSSDTQKEFTKTLLYQYLGTDQVWDNVDYGFETNGGLVMGFYRGYPAGSDNDGKPLYDNYIMVMDINGAQRPNKVYKDMFLVSISRNGDIFVDKDGILEKEEVKYAKKATKSKY